MKNKLPPALDDIINDSQQIRAKTKLLALKQSMEAEGIPLRSICRAMASILAGACAAEYAKWHEHGPWAKQFSKELYMCFYTIHEDFEDCDKELLTIGLCLPPVAMLEPQEIKTLRENAKVSQAVFAALLNTSLSTVQKWETGQKKPTGTGLKLLHLVRTRGLEIVV